MSESGPPDRMPLWLFAAVFLGSPAIMAVAIVAASSGRTAQTMPSCPSSDATYAAISSIQSLLNFLRDLVYRFRFLGCIDANLRD